VCGKKIYAHAQRAPKNIPACTAKQIFMHVPSSMRIYKMLEIKFSKTTIIINTSKRENIFKKRIRNIHMCTKTTNDNIYFDITHNKNCAGSAFAK
jgi:hypothetical protein